MYPGLPAGSRVFAARRAYSGASSVKRGDIVVFVREAEGKTVFREQIGDVSYEVAFDPSRRDRPPDVSVTVPPDQFFVMGDNRFDARDSRYFGPISFSSIIGKKL